MPARVICISRARGAGGEAIGRMVTNALRFRYVDDEILVRAAEKADVDRELVADVEHRKGIMRRVIEVMASSSSSEVEAAAFAPEALVAQGSSANYQDLIREVNLETSEAGDAVIVAHAASMALGARDDVLRVLVTASEAKRCERLEAAAGLSEPDAMKEIAEADGERASYIERFYGIKEELPTHYDLVVNTDILSLAAAAQIVVDAAKA